MDPARAVTAVAAGAVTGVLSGMLGIGGGLVSTPVVRLVLGYPALVAVGTPLAIIVPTTLSGAWHYARRGNIDWHAAVILGLFGTLGALPGARVTEYVGGPAILLATAAILAWAALQLVSSRRPARARRTTGGAWLVALGLAAGVFSGFFGLGGGSLMVPVLARWGGRPMRVALGTSLVAISIIAVPGVAVHAALGHIDWSLAATMAAGVVPGAAVGARLAHRTDEKWLRWLFAAFLMAVAAALAAGELSALVAT